MAVVPLRSEHFVDQDFKEIPKIILSADLTRFTWTNLQTDSEHLQINSVGSNILFQTQHLQTIHSLHCWLWTTPQYSFPSTTPRGTGAWKMLKISWENYVENRIQTWRTELEKILVAFWICAPLALRWNNTFEIDKLNLALHNQGSMDHLRQRFEGRFETETRFFRAGVWTTMVGSSSGRGLAEIILFTRQILHNQRAFSVGGSVAHWRWYRLQWHDFALDWRFRLDRRFRSCISSYEWRLIMWWMNEQSYANALVSKSAKWTTIVRMRQINEWGNVPTTKSKSAAAATRRRARRDRNLIQMP